ncbi:diguanylate cyclase/phosphodiesterase with PAS/PAC sensor [Burkholderiales bacterium GJ-E10]|nr:diguanylate cyclase/phosphodiesterase with PAS/PAC sensor [Burkholderiales bacterium GJ-E10]
MTQRVQTDLAWRNRDDAIEILIDHIPAAVAILDRDMRYLEATRRWLEDYKLARRDILGKSHYEIFPEIPARWKAIHRRALAGEILSAQEERFDRTDGSVQWLRWQVRPWYAAPEQIGGIIILTEDISPRKEAEIALAYEREIFRNLADISSDYFWELDEQFRFRAISPSIAVRSQIDHQAYLGKARWELPFVGISEDQWKEHRAGLSAHLPFRNLEGGLPNLRGEIRWFLMSGDPIFSPDGTFAGYRGVTQDITERALTRERLLESEARYRSLFENMNDGFVLFEVVVGEHGVPIDLLILAANQSFEATTGVKLEQAIGRRLTEAVPGIEKDDADWIGIYGNVALSGVPRQFEQRSDLLDAVYAVSAYRPAPRQCSVTFQDITERKRAESELRIAATAFEVQEGILVTDVHSRILKVNAALTRITGYPVAECIGRTPRIFSSGRHDQRYYKDMWERLQETGRWEGEIWNRRKNGETYPARLSITAVRDVEGRVTNYVANIADITMSLAAAEEIRDLAFYDTLTRLPNRRLFLDRLHQAMASSARNGQKGALLLLDLDNFKTINDTLGHDMGDSLLQQVADRILRALREGDTVARLGGDEFVVLVVNLGDDAFDVAEKAKEVGNKLLVPLNRPFRLGDGRHHNTPSIGVTLFSGKETAEELMKQADIAMYHAKRAGKNTIRFFDRQMQDAVNAHATRERDLRIAIDQQQFELHYQVQVDGLGKAIGAEALIRWHHPVEGLVGPTAFIPIAEESSLIVGIGDWVIDTACAQLAAWNLMPATRHLVISVNVSSRQLRHPDFAAKLEHSIASHGIDVRRLKLEITESMLLEETESTVAVMERLHALGLRLTLDDFGTGYSSLSYLKRLPIDRIKIDQSFIRDMASDPHDLAIIRTIIAMAYNLQIGTIAEGVETDDQLRLLADSGCNTFQGYLFGKPMSIAEFERALRQH